MGSQPAKCLQMSLNVSKMSPNVSKETFSPYSSCRLPWYLLSKSQNVGGCSPPSPPTNEGPVP